VDDRDLILSALPSGVALSTPSFSAVSHLAIENPFDLFCANFVALGGKFATTEDLERLKGMKKWVDPDAAMIIGSPTDAGEIWEAEVGFAVAQAGIAETGTLLFAPELGADRMTTLAPPICFVFLKKADVVPYLADALEAITQLNGNAVLVSGPSRTADIEGVLVRGVHGPGELFLSWL
jgi:L-lactate utilization protein LutC